MITALIVEDDITQLNAIEIVMTKEFKDMKCIKASCYDDAIALLEEYDFQLFLLDIQLDPSDKVHTGLSFGQHVRTLPQYQHTPILFLTAVMNEVQMALNTTHCYNYLVKPYEWKDLLQSIHDLLDSPLMNAQEKVCTLQDINGIYFRFEPSNLLYIHSYKKTLTLYLKNETITTRYYSMEQIADMLPKYFSRCHKSYIINLNELKDYDRSALIVSINDSKKTHIPVGRAHKENFERSMNNYDGITI